MKHYAIIVGGGSGSRMGSYIPKQFLLINGKPIVMYTIEAFYKSDLKPTIILVIPLEYKEYWNELCMEYNFEIPHSIIFGGENRFNSVKNALKELEENSIVAIHDAVRPIIKNQIINNAFLQAELHNNAITAIAVKDSVRQIIGDTSVQLNRDEIYLIQTPQAFKFDILQKAYNLEYNKRFTDDASVVESLGYKINLIAGDVENIKITFPEDLKLAEFYLR